MRLKPFLTAFLLLVIAGVLLGISAVSQADPVVSIGTAAVGFQADATLETPSYDADIALVVSYIVDGAELSGDQVDPDHAAIWAQATSIIPPVWLSRVRQFSLVDGQPAGTVAIVHQSGVDPDRWILTIDIQDADNERLMVETLVHELAHLITLDSAEATFDYRQQGECEGVDIDLGCAHAGSLLARWAEAFWTDLPEPAVYDRDEFVASYAATAAHEDLAETFLHWVIGSDMTGRPGVEAKFAFLDQQAELIGIREQLLAVL